MRVLVVALVALFLGAVLTLIGMNALRKGTAYPNGVMAVMAAQMKQLGDSVKQNRCSETDLQSRLFTLRQLGNDLEPAFLPTQDDERFIARAAEMRGAVGAVLADIPNECTAAGLALDAVGKTCQGCHRDFKN